jgi:ribosomal protein L29
VITPVHQEKNIIEMSIAKVEDDLIKLKTAKENLIQQLAMPGLTSSQMNNLLAERYELMEEVNYLRTEETNLRFQLSLLMGSQLKLRGDADIASGSLSAAIQVDCK